MPLSPGAAASRGCAAGPGVPLVPVRRCCACSAQHRLPAGALRLLLQLNVLRLDVLLCRHPQLRSCSTLPSTYVVCLCPRLCPDKLPQ